MPNIYDYSECDEIADNMVAPAKRLSFDDALAIVKQQMPDESHTVIANTAEALMYRSWRRHPLPAQAR